MVRLPSPQKTFFNLRIQRIGAEPFFFIFFCMEKSCVPKGGCCAWHLSFPSLFHLVYCFYGNISFSNGNAHLLDAATRLVGGVFGGVRVCGRKNRIPQRGRVF